MKNWRNYTATFRGQYCDEDVNECELHEDLRQAILGVSFDTQKVKEILNTLVVPVCGNEGLCTNTQGGYECKCLGGYWADEPTCKVRASGTLCLKY